MKHKIISSLSGFLIASVMIGGAYWVQRQQNLNELDAQRSYIETLEAEIEYLRDDLQQELRAQGQHP